MDTHHTRQRASTVTSMSSDISEEPLAEVDEPPDALRSSFSWSSPKRHAGYTRAPPKTLRRESLLTRQLHSETEHTDLDEPRSPDRTLSTQSTWSSISMPSTAELTSDDGHSVPSTAGSPPLPSIPIRNAASIVEKPVEQVKIVDQEGIPTSPDTQVPTQDPVEANLGRKRCIKFACKGKQDDKPVQPTSAPVVTEPASPPKRKCMLKFICPSRAEADSKSTDKSSSKRPVSPAPTFRASSTTLKHRGSDATLTHLSPQQSRKIPATATETEDTGKTDVPKLSRKYSNGSNTDSDNEGVRFHEFGTSEDEPEDWTQMSTCYRSRLTVDDTLKKENVIRKTCEEVEEEALEEEEVEEDEELDQELAAVAGLNENDDVEDGAEEDDDTDDGFHSDDEDGFANSDSDDDDSDFEWWRPGGLSTAATSMDQLDRLAIVNSQHVPPSTSLGSASSGQSSPYASKVLLRKQPPKQGQTPAMTINRPASPDLPDSTDFVCGTLDEDRPLEQAFVNRRKQKLAAKRGFCPQDIDPTFPTSDPEMEADDENNDEAPPPRLQEEGGVMQDGPGEISSTNLTRWKSPLPAKPTARSPPPAAARHHSPPPPKQRLPRHSPPPQKRTMARSPAPARRLFGQSPGRMTSPAPIKRMTSPPNSPVERDLPLSTAPAGLAARPQPTHTSSLPRGGGITISKLATIPSDDETTDDDRASVHIPKRGAVDIVKGLEKKREYRKRKLAQKATAKAATKGDKPYKVKPGTGCERMREVGLALQEHHGKAEHILSL